MRGATHGILAAGVAALAGAAAAGGQTPAAAHDTTAAVRPHPAPPPAASPLRALAREHILVLPAQYVTFADSLGWSAKVGSHKHYLGTLDDELAFALGERGLAPRWTFARDVERSARRNPTVAADPRALDAGEVRLGRHPDAWQLSDPFASQLRALVALGEARYVLLPVELRFTSRGDTAWATLHLVLIDARRAQIQWAGDVAGAPATRVSPAIAADLASRVAALVAPPPR